MGGSCEDFDGRGGEGVRRWRNGGGTEKGRKRKREERREKRKAGFLLSNSSIHSSIHMSMHGCHAYYCRDDFKHDDQRKSLSAPH